MKNTEKKILVLGSTGKTGSKVVQRLKQRGISVRSGSRSVSPKFDWDDKTTWDACLKNIKSVYISFQPDLAVPGSVEAIEYFSQLAVKNGVEKLVLLSGRGEEEAEHCEQIVIHSGLKWTIVRASWFNQNFSEGFLLKPIQQGEVILPAGNVAEPFVDTDDIADVAVAALTEEGHDGEIYEVTGPRSLTFNDAVAEISKATGREITYQQIPVSDYAAALEEHKVPEDFIWFITYLFTEVLDGRNTSLADGVQRALGREPKDFSEYARKTAATQAWSEQRVAG